MGDCVLEVVKGGSRWQVARHSQQSLVMCFSHYPLLELEQNRDWGWTGDIVVVGCRGLGWGEWFVLLYPGCGPWGQGLQYHSQTGHLGAGEQGTLQRAPAELFSKWGQYVEAGRGSELCPGTWVAEPRGGSWWQGGQSSGHP